MILCHDSPDECNEPTKKSCISEFSALPRFERAARRPCAPPPARAIYFRVCRAAEKALV
jgi:hypothetical protein